MTTPSKGLASFMFYFMLPLNNDATSNQSLNLKPNWKLTIFFHTSLGSHTLLDSHGQVFITCIIIGDTHRFSLKNWPETL